MGNGVFFCLPRQKHVPLVFFLSDLHSFCLDDDDDGGMVESYIFCLSSSTSSSSGSKITGNNIAKHSIFLSLLFFSSCSVKYIRLSLRETNKKFLTELWEKLHGRRFPSGTT